VDPFIARCGQLLVLRRNSAGGDPRQPHYVEGNYDRTFVRVDTD